MSELRFYQIKHLNRNSTFEIMEINNYNFYAKKQNNYIHNQTWKDKVFPKLQELKHF